MACVHGFIDERQYLLAFVETVGNEEIVAMTPSDMFLINNQSTTIFDKVRLLPPSTNLKAVFTQPLKVESLRSSR